MNNMNIFLRGGDFHKQRRNPSDGGVVVAL